jgi:hypothetical protein
MIEYIQHASAVPVNAVYNPAGTNLTVVQIFDYLVIGTILVPVLIFIAVVIAGIRVLVSMGDPKQLETAKKSFIYITIGGFIIVLSYGIYRFFVTIVNL